MLTLGKPTGKNQLKRNTRLCFYKFLPTYAKCTNEVQMRVLADNATMGVTQRIDYKGEACYTIKGTINGAPRFTTSRETET